jgi:hypothetical protein
MEHMRIHKGYARGQSAVKWGVAFCVAFGWREEASQRIAAGFWSACRGPLRLRSGQAFDYTGNPPSRVAGSAQGDNLCCLASD